MNDTIYLIKNVKVTDPQSSWNDQVVDVLVEEGRVVKMAVDIQEFPNDARVYQQFHCISPGWVDPWNHGAKAGEEHHQSVADWMVQVEKSGITTLALSPSKMQASEPMNGMEFNPFPSGIEAVNALAFAPLSQHLEGKRMVNYGMYAQAGAVGFTDGFPNHTKTALALEAAKYTSIMPNHHLWNVLPEPDFGRNYQIWEGVSALTMGLDGMPNFVESEYLQNLSNLAEYTNKKMVYPLLSSTMNIPNSKFSNEVILGTAPQYFWWSDSAMQDFSEKFKFWPPLAPELSLDNWFQAFKSGLISFLCSDHRPWHPDAIDLPFPMVPFGQSTLANFTLAAWTKLKERMSPSEFVQVISIGGRKALGLAEQRIEEGMDAEFTFWNPEGHTPAESKSPWGNQMLSGQIEGRMLKNKLYPLN